MRWAARCRYCCKSPKLSGDNFPATRRSDRRPPICVASITLPSSPVSLSLGDEVPHIFIRDSHQRPRKILITVGNDFCNKICQFRTHAVQKNLLIMFQRRLSCVGRIGSNRFLRSIHNSRQLDREGRSATRLARRPASSVRGEAGCSALAGLSLVHNEWDLRMCGEISLDSN
jgi:hypothetical protein